MFVTHPASEAAADFEDDLWLHSQQHPDVPVCDLGVSEESDHRHQEHNNPQNDATSQQHDLLGVADDREYEPTNTCPPATTGHWSHHTSLSEIPQRTLDICADINVQNIPSSGDIYDKVKKHLGCIDQAVREIEALLPKTLLWVHTFQITSAPDGGPSGYPIFMHEESDPAAKECPTIQEYPVSGQAHGQIARQTSGGYECYSPPEISTQTQSKDGIDMNLPQRVSECHSIHEGDTCSEPFDEGG